MCLAFQSFPAPLCRVVAASANALVIDESLVVFSPEMTICAMSICGHYASLNPLRSTLKAHAIGIAAFTIPHTSISTRIVCIIGMAFRALCLGKIRRNDGTDAA